jgi:hypothetical protein
MVGACPADLTSSLGAKAEAQISDITRAQRVRYDPISETPTHMPDD